MYITIDAHCFPSKTKKNVLIQEKCPDRGPKQEGGEENLIKNKR